MVKSSKGKSCCGFTNAVCCSDKISNGCLFHAPSLFRGNISNGWKSDETAWLMDLDTLTKYPVAKKEKAICQNTNAIQFGQHLCIGTEHSNEPLNARNSSIC